ncbi:flagellar basal-body MS-ring/collar protein FliF [Piscirickettsia litoralis]|uniref:Flagellar M-ring protein n=1 Tax=Piscirickettsia litoralis TaxID=1891921 RepID=A0ABX3A383_9GAMM|nr:flagellar basal-body MS-ring/collar protein FliF [Piscirickettsia litoralis]ODN42697.1 flagellar M-ring protein FliF [Piscirickettsia litoralis]
MAMNLESASQVIEGFNRLNWLKQVALMVGLAVSIALGVAVIMWTKTSNYEPVFSSSDPLSLPHIVQSLKQGNIDFKLDEKRNLVLVSKSDVNRARIVLAENGVSGRMNTGFENLGKNSSFGTSQFMETVRYRHALESELSRTIASIQGVRSARVHLAIPKQSSFLKSQKEARASVFVNLQGGYLDKSQVAAIVNLTASSVPNLKRNQVSVVDQHGNLLTNSMESSGFAATERQFSYQRQVESAYVQRIMNILEPIVGAGNVRAQVTANVDFTKSEKTQETFNPDMKAVRSEFLLNEERSGEAGLGGIPGALSNEPPGAGVAPEQAAGDNNATKTQQTPSSRKNESTRNYEVDRLISHTKGQLGRVTRLTVAVVLNNKRVTDAQGKTTAQAIAQGEINRIAQLVRDAVGFDVARGDSLNVVNLPFVAEMEIKAPSIPLWEQGWFAPLIKQILGGLFILILVFFILKPTLRSLAGKSKSELFDQKMQLAREVGIELDTNGNPIPPEEEPLVDEFDRPLDLPQDSDDQERNINFVKQLVEKDAKLVAQVIKEWVNEDEQ